MNWFTDIPKIVSAIIVVSAVIGVISFNNSIDYGNPDKLDENSEKTRDFVVDNVVSIEIKWISWIDDKVTNPLVLLVLFFGILWFFGPFPPKSRQ